MKQGNHPKIRKDLTGQRFGRLTVVEPYYDEHNHLRWLCECDCGNTTIVYSNNLTRGNTLSCGCLNKEINAARLTKHGGRGTRLYEIWKNMRKRCNNPHDPAYENYGGRGICICKEWDDFATFRDWAESNGYADDLTIDRMDVNGNYEPDNCRWATYGEQANNTRSNRRITFDGKTLTIAEWSTELGIPASTISNRLDKLNWTVAEALNPIARPRPRGTDNPRFGVPLTEEHKQHLKDAHCHITGSDSPCAKTVMCVETGEIFGSGAEAAAKYGIPRSVLSRACTGKKETAAGMHWKYITSERSDSNGNHPEESTT